MDTETTSPAMPRSAPFEPHTAGAVEAAAASHDPTEHIGVFGHLVHDDGDIAGLVAYSIYKQNKLDWLRAFEAAKGRAPDEAELGSYIIGEGTPRRLATYRHLAEATLAGNGPEVDGAASSAGRPVASGRRAIGKAPPTGLIALYALIAVLFLAVFYLALHFTATGH